MQRYTVSSRTGSREGYMPVGHGIEFIGIIAENKRYPPQVSFLQMTWSHFHRDDREAVKNVACVIGACHGCGKIEKRNSSSGAD